MSVPTWFDEARFGMFIHWGHSSQQGIELSWPLVGPSFALPESRPVPVSQYHSSAATFDPQGFDAAALARTAKAAGMQYAVLTTKHHDGFAMFDTKTSDFGVMHSTYGRDIVRQFADAMRAEGIRVGFYFSLIDWAHPDYPAFTQDDVPYKFPFGKRLDPDRWPKFVDVMFEQVRELLTNYGKVDLIWFDGGWERSVDQWRAKDLEAMIRELQPDIVINDRLPGCGDYATPEQFVPARPPDGPWEACMTMNESWGYNPADTRYKSARQLVHTLCEIAARGGKLLLNVSPRGDGTLPPEQLERIDAVTSWMFRNSESIIDTEPALEPWQFYGPTTKACHSENPSRDGTSVPSGAGNTPTAETLYLHLLMRPYETVTVRGIRIKRVQRATALRTGEELKFTTRCSIIDQFANRDPNGELTIAVPASAIDELATVVKVELSASPPGANS